MCKFHICQKSKLISPCKLNEVISHKLKVRIPTCTNNKLKGLQVEKQYIYIYMFARSHKLINLGVQQRIFNIRDENNKALNDLVRIINMRETYIGEGKEYIFVSWSW